MSQPSAGQPLVIVSVFVFGKPAWEIDGLEGSCVDFELLGEISSCGQQLNRRLARCGAGEVGGRYGLLYEVDFSKATSLKDVEEELKALGAEPDEVSHQGGVRRLVMEGSRRMNGGAGTRHLFLELVRHFA